MAGPMEQIVLIIHLILALSLITTVLLQRSEGGGLGMGGPNAAAAGRPATTPAQKFTWALAIAFIVTSITLTILSAQASKDASVLDRLGVAPAAAPQEAPATLNGESLLPPSAPSSDPMVPTVD